MKRTMRSLLLCGTISLAIFCSGCMQVETLVKLNEDGSATVTERLRFSARLLDMAQSKAGKTGVAQYLEKSYAQQRAPRFGKGAVLIDHKVVDAEGGARDAISVFKVPDINDFQYSNPFLATGAYANRGIIKCNVAPLYASDWTGAVAGQLSASFHLVGSAPKAAANQKPPPAAPKPLTPKQEQTYRQLQPVFQDICKGFMLKLTFEAYSPIRFRRYYRYRGASVHTHQYDLINFDDADLDSLGGVFLGNEEIMLELLHGKLSGENVVQTVAAHAGNATLPIFHPKGISNIWFSPSRHHFDQFFKGKSLSSGGKKPKTWPAKFQPLRNEK